MTKEQLRIKVAEACEWRYNEPPETSPDPTYWERTINGRQTIAFGSDELPNYPEDLNACAEFERTLLGPPNRLIRQQYRRELDSIRGATPIWHTTAEQRCIAFLKVKGVYE